MCVAVAAVVCLINEGGTCMGLHCDVIRYGLWRTADCSKLRPRYTTTSRGRNSSYSCYCYSATKVAQGGGNSAAIFPANAASMAGANSRTGRCLVYVKEPGCTCFGPRSHTGFREELSVEVIPESSVLQVGAEGEANEKGGAGKSVLY